MQSIGIIPEAGSLAGGKSAGGTSADGFLALLAALDGGAGLLLPSDLRGDQKKTLGQSLTGNLQAGAAEGQSAKQAQTGELSADNASLIAAAVNGPQATALPKQGSAPRNTATQNSLAQQPQQTPAFGPTPEAPLPQTGPAATPGGQAIDSLASTTTPAQPAATPTTGSPQSTATGPTQTKPPAPHAPTPNVTAPSSREQNAQQARTPAVPVVENGAGSNTQQTTTGKAPIPESPAPQLAAQTQIANQPQAQAQTQVKSGAASTAPAAVAPRGTANSSGDSQVSPTGGLAQDGSKTPGNDQPSAGRERTLMASTHPTKAAQIAKAAKQAKALAAAEQQAEQVAKPNQGVEQQVAQNAQQSARPALWTAALASIQALQSVDSDSLGQGMGSIDSAVEPLTSPSSSTTAKAGSEGYSQVARNMPAMPPSEQLAVQIQRAVNAQVQRFSIRLEPAELGRIDVRLDFARDGSVNAAITVERPETFDLMQRDIQALERSLKESGVQGEGLKLDLQLGTGRQEQQDAQSEQPADYRQSADTVDEELPTLPDLPAISRAGGMTGLIDIRA